ncbi:hypothetical protein F0249_20040, partial [Vibrio sp. 03-59-1]|nr:hypothetical protein [Vibrio sp. 03-59-1]
MHLQLDLLSPQLRLQINLTNNLRVTPNSWRFHSGLKFVFTVQWFSLGVIALSHLNWALTDPLIISPALHCVSTFDIRTFPTGI